MSLVSDPNLLNVNKPNGHRWVKSLVREFDEVYVNPVASTSISPSPPPSGPSGHVRRAASISSFTSIPSNNAGSSVSNTLTSRSISPSQSTNMRSMKATQPLASTSSAPAPSPIFSKRRISAAPAPILVARENGYTNGRVSPGVINPDQITEEGEEENGEASDVFLPMSPSSALPYTVNYNSNGSTPATPSFTPRSGVEHSRKHSRIHERNLSAFFPRPGEESTGYGDTFGESSNPSPEIYDHQTSTAPNSAKSEETATKNRRGHHHRHSLSHNFSSFLDPNKLPSELNPLKSLIPSSASSINTPINSIKSNFLPVPTHSQNTKYSRLPSTLRFLLLTLSLPFSTKAAIALSCAQINLGATLWIAGQNGESLSTTGLGYLVVFDGMGGLSRIFVEGSNGIEIFWNSMNGGKTTDRSVRLPFGPHRLVTLSHFSQAIYLLFSAVYVCKESVEHVLLLHGPNENDGNHGVGHGMGHSSESSVLSGTPTTTITLGIALPVILLALSAIFSLISAVALKNHHQLSDTVGPSGLSFARPRSQSKKVTMFDLIGNPFTVTIVTFSIGLSLASHVIPSAQLGPLDKVVALLQSIAMFYIAYPAAIATGQVLLQTSPLNNGGQMDAFTSALRDIENHPLIVKVSPPHLWQLTPHPSSSTEDKKSSSTKNNNSGRRSSSTNTNQDSMIASTLIATLVIKVKSEVNDIEILNISRFVKDRCGPAMKWGGEEAIEGELTVEILREKKSKGNENHSSHQHDHSSHQHDHQHHQNQHSNQHQHSHEGHSH